MRSWSLGTILISMVSGLVILALVGCSAPPAEPVETLLPADATWHYLADFQSLRSVPGNWDEPDYSDADWPTGETPFGSKDGSATFDDGSEARTILPLEEGGSSLPTYLFRADFELTADEMAGLASSYAATVTFDDAITVYVNGTDVLAENWPKGGYDSITALGANHTRDLPNEALLEVPSDLLIEGPNVIAVELRQGSEGSSDIWFNLGSLDANRELVEGGRDGTIVLGVGESSGEMLVTWQGEGDAGSVTYRGVDEGAVDVASLGAELEGVDAGGAGSVEVQADASSGVEEGATTFVATLEDLEPGQSYAYRVADEGASGVYGFIVPEIDDGFSFIANGDPQIVDAEDKAPILAYLDLVDSAANGDGSTAPVDFLMTLGDQSDVADDPAVFERYLSCGLFRTLPVAPIRGNHEAAADLYEDFFPQLSEQEGDTARDSGDYWFWRGDTLFLCLDSNEEDAAVHARFVAEAKEESRQANGEPTWIIAAFHHAPYSVGNHADSDSTLARRETLVPILEDAGVDLVLNGHDHVYTRTYPMWQGKPLTSASADTTTADGIVFLTLGSSTGTKYYDHTDSDTPYAAFSNPEDTPSIARIDVTDEELQISVYSLGTDDEISLLDQATITQSAENEAFKEAA